MSVGLALASIDARATECGADTDCKGERICRKGQCVDPGEKPSDACAQDADCRGGEVCEKERCVAARTTLEKPMEPSAESTTAEKPKQHAHGAARPKRPKRPIAQSVPLGPDTVMVAFSSASSEKLWITALNTGDQCRMPCSLRLPQRETATLRVRGDTNVEASVDVSAVGGSYELRGDSTLLALGLTLCLAGAGTGALGIVAIKSSREQDCAPDDSSCAEDKALQTTMGSAGVAAGVFLMVGGTVATVFGLQKRFFLNDDEHVMRRFIPQFAVRPLRSGTAFAAAWQF